MKINKNKTNSARRSHLH